MLTKKKFINFANDNSKIIFLNANKRLYFESNIDQKFISEAREFCGCTIIREDLFRRYYPYGSIAGTVVGFAGADGGLDGVEELLASVGSRSIRASRCRNTASGP